MRLKFLIAVVALVACQPTPSAAQGLPAVVGDWEACFRSGANRPATVCGTLALDYRSGCGVVGAGSYSVPFDRLGIPDTTAAGSPQFTPPNQTTFAWDTTGSGDLRLTRTVEFRDSVDGTQVCVATNSSDFEAKGRLVGDSIVGTWGWYDHYRGETTLGTFVLRGRQDPH